MTNTTQRFEAHTSTLEDIQQFLSTQSFELPHADFNQLPAPFYLIQGDSVLDEFETETGTFVFTRNLTVKGGISVRHSAKPRANIIVLGDLRVKKAYIDGFVVVSGNLKADLIIGDSTWDGGIFVGKDLVSNIFIHKDIDVEVLGKIVCKKDTTEDVGDLWSVYADFKAK